MNTNRAMTTSCDGIEFIKRFEGKRLKAYQDSVGVWTIGYGSTKDVTEGLEIDEAGATLRLLADVRSHERFVNDLVTVELSQEQFDALSSFTFNLGGGSLKRSTLLKHLSDSEYDEAAAQFLVWVRADGKALPGLMRRRMAECKLFLLGRYE